MIWLVFSRFYYSKIIEIKCTIGSPDKDEVNKIYKQPIWTDWLSHWGWIETVPSTRFRELEGRKQSDQSSLGEEETKTDVLHNAATKEVYFFWDWYHLQVCKILILLILTELDQDSSVVLKSPAIDLSWTTNSLLSWAEQPIYAPPPHII